MIDDRWLMLRVVSTYPVRILTVVTRSPPRSHSSSNTSSDFVCMYVPCTVCTGTVCDGMCDWHAFIVLGRHKVADCREQNEHICVTVLQLHVKYKYSCQYSYYSTRSSPLVQSRMRHTTTNSVMHAATRAPIYKQVQQ